MKKVLEESEEGWGRVQMGRPSLLALYAVTSTGELRNCANTAVGEDVAWRVTPPEVKIGPYPTGQLMCRSCFTSMLAPSGDAGEHKASERRATSRETTAAHMKRVWSVCVCLCKVGLRSSFT